jgi:hypothetical protein
MHKLARLAARSAALREAVLEKEAGLLGSTAKTVGSWAVKNPGKALGVGLTGALTPMAVKGSFRQSKAGFDPAMQQAMLGPVPGV